MLIPNLDAILNSQPNRARQRRANIQQPEEMMTENEVIDLLTIHLISLGFSDVAINHTDSRGVDIKAANPATCEEYLIECKGHTSSKSGTNAHGEPFGGGNVKHSVAAAVYASMKQLSDDFQMSNFVSQKRTVAIGVPDSRFYRKAVHNILPMLERLAITVFVVKSSGVVTMLEG
jgi:hypothetical protein